MKKELFEELASLMTERAKLDERIESVRNQVSAEMEQNEVDKVESDYGNFYFVVRKKWTYCEAIQTAEEKLKAAKKKAEESGTATCEESKSLTFRPTRNPQE